MSWNGNISGALLFFAGLIGLTTSSIYSLLVLCAAIRLVRKTQQDNLRLQAHPNPSTDYLPSITVMKPLHGAELKLEENLRSFFAQDYHGLAAASGAHVEYLFCAREESDAGLRLVRRLSHEYPELSIQTFVSGEPWGPNAKLCSLAVMAKYAGTNIWVVSDSDVAVTPEYLRFVVAPLSDNKIGCVTCLYRGIAPGRGLWALLEAAGMSVEMSSGVAVSVMLSPMRFALGPTMVLRRECVDSMGGFEALVEYCSDDFVLGNRTSQQSGRLVELSSYVVEHIVLNLSFIDSVRHQVRWMKSTRCSVPKAHLGTVLTFAMPYGLLACIGATMLGHQAVGVYLLSLSVVGRMVQAFIAGRYIVRERLLWQTILLFPIRDLMGFFFWLMSYRSRRIVWRDEVYELQSDGRMRKVIAH